MFSFQETMRYVKRVLKTPYHYFSKAKDSNSEVMLYLEDQNGPVHSFRGRFIVDALQNAEKYAKQEIKAGSLKEPNIKKNDNK